MLKKLFTKKGLGKGFTIIEVMIVLAIAGLIMVVVLVAVPQLQRSQRNNASTAVIDRIMTELQNYATNNNGSYPSDATTQTAFCLRYLQRTVAATPPATGTVGDCMGTGATGANFINDPRTGTPVRLSFAATTTPAVDSNGTNARTVVVHTGAGGYRCNGESVVAASGARQIAITLFLEGGAVACRDNQ